MPSFLVGSGQTYTTIQGAVDAVAALGDLVGLGNHEIIVDAGHTEAATLVLSSLQAKTDGRVIIKSASGVYHLECEIPIIPVNYVTIQNFEALPLVGFTGSNLVGAGGSHTEFYLTNFKLKNPNAIVITTVYAGIYAFDGIVEGFNGGFKHAFQGLKEGRRLTAYGNYRGFKSCQVLVDCVSAGSTAYDFDTNITVSYCASDDATATGTGSIINIDPAVEFVNAAAGDYTLASGSQLIAAGSTGNNIGWDQTEVNAAPVLDTPASDFELQESQVWSYDFGANFSDANTGDTATYSASPDLNAVTGFTFDTATGIATADATKAIAVGVEYTITRTDSGGLTANDVVMITVIANKLTIGTISDTTPEINTQITVDHTNALGTLTTPNFNIASQTGTQAVIDIPDITTFILAGQTYPTINFNTAVAIPLSDGTNSDDVDLVGIANPAGTFFGEITSIPSNSDYANDTGAVAGMFGYFFDIIGVFQIDPATGVVMADDAGGSYKYKLYNGEWGSATTNTIAARPQDQVSIDSSATTKTGAQIEVSYPGADLTGFQYRIDGGAWVASTASITLTGLTAETTYTFEVTAVNSGRIGDITSATITTQDGVDTTPTAFSFTPQTGLALNAAVVFGPMTVSDVDAGVDVPVSITNGTYSVSTNGGSTYGAETSAATNVRLNYLIRVHHNAESTYETQRQTTLTVGGVSATASSTTAVNPAAGISESSGNPLPANFYVRVGTPYSLSQHVNNTDSVALNYAIAQGSPALPSGVTLNASTGEITTTDNNYTPVSGISFEVTLA